MLESLYLPALLLINVGGFVAAWLGWSRGVETAPAVPAATDPLTGFISRAALVEAAAPLVEPGRRKRPATLLLVDLDGFRSFNELHGHLSGDTLLRIAADTIRGAVPPGALLARLGPDRFAACFIPEAASMPEAAAASILERLARPTELGGIAVHVTASAGIACADADCTGIEALLRRADIALAAAKAGGRGRALAFDASMQRELAERNATEAAMRRGIPAGEFVPYFEQQVDMASGSLLGFEMLARWQHPEKGLVAPDSFIGVAEECGLIGELSLSVMRQAMAEARGWDNGLTLSVNISPIQLRDPWLAQKIAKLLAETGFPAERLEIEITESSLLENLGLAQAIVSSLKNQCIRLSLDDFGTGYSSIAHLRALPFDRIKIDRSFVAAINDDPESAAVVTAITRLAESLNLAVTAEGVEDELIEARLRSIGTYSGQGWLFGKPMQVEEVRTLLAAKGLLPAARSFAGGRRKRTETEKLRRAG